MMSRWPGMRHAARWAIFGAAPTAARDAANVLSCGWNAMSARELPGQPRVRFISAAP
ncbi:hypothetical protein XMIN_958 [Xanthomonas citri pv. mangiferaeindicae LMG 941]|nr:hypothetical protein XMIN_958 [Xanthomonas citri pv. mangiferaeindicae LMG 941]